MTPSQVMRALAQKFIDSKTGKVSGVCFGGSQYICDLLEDAGTGVGDRTIHREAALAYLRTLGMGSGFSEFYTGEERRDDGDADTCELARRRAAWLLFAADLYDEGVR